MTKKQREALGAMAEDIKGMFESHAESFPHDIDRLLREVVEPESGSVGATLCEIEANLDFIASLKEDLAAFMRATPSGRKEEKADNARKAKAAIAKKAKAEKTRHVPEAGPRIAPVLGEL